MKEISWRDFNGLERETGATLDSYAAFTGVRRTSDETLLTHCRIGTRSFDRLRQSLWLRRLLCAGTSTGCSCRILWSGAESEPCLDQRILGLLGEPLQLEWGPLGTSTASRSSLDGRPMGPRWARLPVSQRLLAVTPLLHEDLDGDQSDQCQYQQDADTRDDDQARRRPQGRR